MRDSNESTKQSEQTEPGEARKPYEAPRVLKKRSVARVTLTSGGGATSVGVISTTN